MSDHDLEEGWTRVRGGKKAPPVPHPSSSELAADDTTAEKLALEFEKRMEIWRLSTCRTQLHQIIDKWQPDEGWSFTTALCLASGSFSRDNREAQRRTMYQFAAFLDTVRHLQGKTSSSIGIFAQDPMYNSVDKAFLSDLNITVLDISMQTARSTSLHLAADHLGSQTLVFELCIEISLGCMRPFCDHDIPLYVGTLFNESDRYVG